MNWELIGSIVIGILLAEFLRDSWATYWRQRKVEKTEKDPHAEGRRMQEEYYGNKSEEAAKQRLQEDWDFLWGHAPDSAKETVREMLDDITLKQRAQEADLWVVLWTGSDEYSKVQLIRRWKEAGVQQRWKDAYNG